MQMGTQLPWYCVPNGIAQVSRVAATVGAANSHSFELQVLSRGGARVRGRCYSNTYPNSSGYINFGYFTSAYAYVTSTTVGWVTPKTAWAPLSVLKEGLFVGPAHRFTDIDQAPITGHTFTEPVTPTLGGPQQEWDFDLYVPYGTFLFGEDYANSVSFICTLYIYEYNTASPIG